MLVRARRRYIDEAFSKQGSAVHEAGGPLPTPPNLTVRLTLGEFEQQISVAGEVDVSNADHLTRFVGRVVDCTDGDVSVDLADVAYMDSTGLSVLLQARQTLLAHGRRLAVRNPSASVVMLLDLCGLTEHLGVGNLHLGRGNVAATV
jgi:anti-sigma B factor antagonist